MIQDGSDGEELQNRYETVLTGDLLVYYTESAGNTSLVEEMRLCEAMIKKLMAKERFEEARKWMSSKAGLVRSRWRNDSTYAAMRDTFAQTINGMAEAELQRMEQQHARADAEEAEQKKLASAETGALPGSGGRDREVKEASEENGEDVAPVAGDGVYAPDGDCSSAFENGSGEQDSDGPATQVGGEADTNGAEETDADYVDLGGGHRVSRDALRAGGVMMVAEFLVEPEGGRLFGGEIGRASGPGTVNGYVVDQDIWEAANSTVEGGPGSVGASEAGTDGDGDPGGLCLDAATAKSGI